MTQSTQHGLNQPCYSLKKRKSGFYRNGVEEQDSLDPTLDKWDELYSNVLVVALDATR